MQPDVLNSRYQSNPGRYPTLPTHISFEFRTGRAVLLCTRVQYVAVDRTSKFKQARHTPYDPRYYKWGMSLINVPF